MKYKSYGTEYELSFHKTTYRNNGSLAIQVMCKTEEEEWEEPFCMLTTNLAVSPTSPNRAYIDINNVPQDLVQKLLDAKVFKFTGIDQMSGWCIYPEAEFDKEWLDKI